MASLGAVQSCRAQPAAAVLIRASGSAAGLSTGPTGSRGAHSKQLLPAQGPPPCCNPLRKQHVGWHSCTGLSAPTGARPVTWRPLCSASSSSSNSGLSPKELQKRVNADRIATVLSSLAKETEAARKQQVGSHNK